MIFCSVEKRRSVRKSNRGAVRMENERIRELEN